LRSLISVTGAMHKAVHFFARSSPIGVTVLSDRLELMRAPVCAFL
jgi:hypothetical protein